MTYKNLKPNLQKIQSHAQYTDNDFAYLRAKGYNEKEIINIWDNDYADNKSPVTWSSEIAQKKLRSCLSK